MQKISFRRIFQKDQFSFRREILDAYIFAICIFFLSPPFYVWNLLSPFIFVVLCTLLVIRNIKSIKSYKPLFFLFFFLLYFFIGFKSNSTVFGYISLLGLCILILSDDLFIKDVFEKYIIIFSLTLIPSILVFLSINILSIDFPNTIIEPFNNLKEVDYIRYPFLVQENGFFDFILPRFNAYYDEPGVVGTVTGLLLICNGFNLKNKINIPIFIAGLLSFSLAFYVIALVYGFLFLSVKYKIIFTTVLIGIVFLFSENEMLDSYIFSRFEFIDGKFVGDNRSMDESFDLKFEEFTKTNQFYFGMGENSSRNLNFGGASYKDIIIDFGIIAFGLLILLLTLLAFIQFGFSKHFFVYMFLIFSILYQRPFVSSYFYFFLLYAPLYYINQSKVDLTKEVDNEEF